MSKRFTESSKWMDKWFRSLGPTLKLAWCYLLDNCDAAGVIDLDRELADFQIGAAVDWDVFMRIADSRITVTRSGKWFINNFIQFQYGKLSPDCKPHVPVIQLLERHGIDINSIHQNKSFKYGSVTSSRRSKVLARDGYTCCYCGDQFGEKDLVVDHVIPASSGGPDVEGNLVAACVECNSSKWDGDPVAFIEKTNSPADVWQRLSQRLSERVFETLKEKEKDKEKDKDKERDKDKGAGGGGYHAKVKRFSPPSVAEVAAYCTERGNSVNPQNFVDFYASKGWRVGDQSMKDWKAAVRTWESNSRNRGSPAASGRVLTRNGTEIISDRELFDEP